jgi:hypothetical protein
LVAFLHASEFPSEIPRAQNHNFSYTNTLAHIKNEHLAKIEQIRKTVSFFLAKKLDLKF